MRPRSALGLLFALPLALATGCATTKQAAGPSEPPIAQAGEARDPATVALEPFEFEEDGFAYVDGRTGESLSFDEVAARAREAEVVLTGEQHDQASHHHLQARVVGALGEAQGGLAVGLEMVNWQQQEALDRFSEGEIDVDGLFSALDWERTWGHDADLYREVLAVGQEAGARFVALNAPRALVRAVAKKGLDGLTDEEKAQLPELDLTDEVHRSSIEAVFKHHHPPTGAGEAFERFYAAQVLWDESMADRSVKALESGAQRLVVLAGVGHVAGYRGIPQRIARRRPGTRLLTIVPITLSEKERPEDVARVAIAEGEADILAIKKPREVISL